MWMNEAKRKCPEIRFARVTNVRGRADLTKYRDASKQVADVLQTFTQNIERASIDESYIDVTDLVAERLANGFERLNIEQMSDTHVVGCETAHFLSNLDEYNEFTEVNCKLAVGGLIAQEIRAAIFQKTGYKCSAGIAHNKILSKLSCGFHKPNQQTILPADAVSELFSTLPLKKIKRLGGKFGESVSQALQVTNVGDLLKYSEKDLTRKFDEKMAKWLYNIARGVDLEPVTTRVISKSISCCKRFPFKYVLTALGSVEHWLNELSIEVTDRLEQELVENNRKARQITISFAQEIEKKTVSGSKTFPLTCYKQEKIFRDAFEIVKRNLAIKSDGSLIVNFLGLCAGNFQENKKNNIVDLLKKVNNNKTVKKHPLNSKPKEENIKVEKGDVSTSKIIPGQSRDRNNSAIFEENDACTSNSEVANSAEENFTSTQSINNIDIKISYDDTFDEFDHFSDQDGHDDTDKSQEWFNSIQNNEFVNYDTFREKDSKSDETSDGNKDSQNRVCSNQNLNESGNASTSLKDQYANSFFLNYFANMEKKNRENKTREKAFQELNENLRSSLEKISRESTSPVQEHVEDTEICLECRKKIPSYEMASHMDYHFAVKLANEEKASNKNTTTDKKQNVSPSSKIKKSKKSSSTSDISKNGSKKRKGSLENKSITSFLEKFEELNESNSSVCGDCRKRIKFEEFGSHSDYHAAKKLHSELNSNVSKSNFVAEKGAAKNSVRTRKDIASFFKKV